MNDRDKKKKPTLANTGSNSGDNKGAGIRPRNPLATHPLLKKSHSHEKSKKSQRSKDKQSLRKRVWDDD